MSHEGRRRGLGLRTRVLSLLGVIFSVVIATAVYRAVERREADALAAKLALEARVDYIASLQAQSLIEVERLLRVAATLGELDALGRNPQCAAVLDSLTRDDPRVVDVLLLGPQGETRCAQRMTPTVSGVAAHPFLEAARSSATAVVGPPMKDAVAGQWVLPVALGFGPASPEGRGALVVMLGLDWVNRAFARNPEPRGAHFGLVDARGVVIARFPADESSQGAPAFPLPGDLDAVQMTEVRTRTDAPALVVSRRFALTAAGPVYAVIRVPLAAVTEAADRQLMQAIALSLALMGFTVTAVWLGSERWFLRPLASIAETATRLGRGDHLARTGLATTGDELGQLACIVDSMADALGSTNELLRLNRALKMIIQANRILVQATSEREQLDEICRTVVEVGGYRMAWVGFCEHDEAKTVRPVAQHGFLDDYLTQAHITWDDSERGRGPTGTAIKTGIPQVNQNCETNPAFAPWRADALKRGYRSSIALPLRAEQEVIGALMIYSRNADAFDNEELNLMQELAQDLAFGIVNRRLRLAHDQNLLRLQRTMEATVQAVATTVEYRDPYTAGHQRRVADLAVAIAREMGIPEAEIHGIHLAGVVHDIGKIKVPKEVLVKVAALTREEYELIKRHPADGYEILKGIDFPWPIAAMVRQHHERIDGSGYPDGLRDEDILPGSRILAVADVVEAMSLDRPYRKSPGIEAALEVIDKGRGSAFDGAVVDACIALFRQKGFSFGDVEVVLDMV